MHALHPFLNQVLFRSWWVVIFLLLSTALYEHKQKDTERIRNQLKEQLFNLKEEKNRALQEQQQLQLEIESQEDSAWIELTLIKKLGVVPKGKRKVVFNINT